MLGGLAHFVGVTRLYLNVGLPDANRVLLDVWIGEAQIVGGAFYLAAYRARLRGLNWRGQAVAGAVTVLAYTLPFLPVLFSRASVPFRLPPAAYAIASIVILRKAVLSERRRANSEGRETKS